MINKQELKAQKEVIIMEKIIEKIKKLLAMTEENGASKNEAMIAALKAQKLMAEYNIDITDIRNGEESQEIIEESFNCGNGDKWKYTLADIVARNFCCETWFIGKTHVVFFGYNKDAKIARNVFEFLFKTGNKLADKCYYEYYKNGESTKGVKNAYLLGFSKGIDEALSKQCTALMIVTPKDVTEAFEEKTKGWKNLNGSLTFKNDNRAYEKGRTEGKNMANARSIEG